MTDDRTDKEKRIEPKIRVDDERLPSDGLYTGSLFDRGAYDDERSDLLDDDFELTATEKDKRRRQSERGKWDDDADDAPIIPNSDRIEIPPAGRPSSASAKPSGELPLGAMLGGGALLLAAYAVWSGLGVTERIERLEQRPAPQVEEAATQAQSIQALSKRIDELQQKLAEQEALIQKQKGALEAQIEKQASRHQADLGALIQGEEAKHKAMLQELSSQLAKSKAAAAARQATAEPPAKPAPAATPAAKPKPAVKKPVEEMIELPGPIESASEVGQSTSPAAAGRQPSWGVNVVSLESEAAARQEASRLKEMGIQAEILEIPGSDRTMYRVRVAGFASKEEAQQMQGTLAKEHGITGTWVNNQ